MEIFQPSNVRCMLELWPKVQRTRALCSRCVAHNNAVFVRIDFMIVTRDRALVWDWFVICWVASVCHRAKQNLYGAKSQPPVNFALLSLFWWLVRLVIKSEPLKPILRVKIGKTKRSTVSPLIPLSKSPAWATSLVGTIASYNVASCRSKLFWIRY